MEKTFPFQDFELILEPMQLTPKQTGYLTLLIVFSLLGWGAFALWDKSRSTIYQVRVYFEEIGSLKPENPVFKNGISVGKVASIGQVDGKSVVTLDFDNPIQLRQGSQIINRNFALLGERVVAIETSPTGEFIDLTQLIPGVYERGFSESLHLVQLAIEQVALVQQALLPYAIGTDSTNALHTDFNSLMGGTVRLLDLLEVFVNKTEPLLIKTLQEGSTLGVQVAKETDQINGKLGQIIADVGSAQTQIQSKLLALGSGLYQIENQLTSLENHPLYKEHLQHRKLIDEVQQGLQSTTRILTAIKTGGANLEKDPNSPPIIGLSNIHFFSERASDKRKRKNEKK